MGKVQNNNNNNAFFFRHRKKKSKSMSVSTSGMATCLNHNQVNRDIKCKETGQNIYNAFFFGSDDPSYIYIINVCIG